MRPWNAYQVVIILAVFIVAHVMRAICAGRFREWLRTREGWPKWRLRWALTIHKRLRGIIFVALLWLVVFAMREFTWPSRSYILGIAANLSLAWLIVTFATRLIAIILCAWSFAMAHGHGSPCGSPA